MFSKQLGRIPAGEVRTFFCTDIAETLQSLETDKINFTEHPSKVIVHAWAVLPEQEQLIEDVLHKLAEIAQAIWPGWYGLPVTTAHPLLTAPFFDIAALRHLPSPSRQPISVHWAKAAAQACSMDRAPLLRGFTRGQQLSQLALAVDPGNLLIILASHDQQPLPYRLLGLARVAVWLATTTTARVALLAPPGLARHAELESLAYHAVTVGTATPPVATVDETARSSVWPLQGRPHPFSPGEQLLAERLVQDRELAPLFVYNECIETVCQSRYWVDLLWHAGQVVVEIDGYRNHSSRTAFHQDRQRDYELLLSGYRVLRLPHDEVMADVAMALAKIRQVVQLVKSNGTASSSE
ncbi:MAG: DUF559 domain-containing protein [Caldilineaceae bacterium]